MHGQPRNKKSDESAASKSKSIELQRLQSLFLHNHHNKIYTDEALEISSKLLQMNPEVYTGWNYRKLAVQHNINPDTNTQSIKSILDQELKLVEMSLRTNYKSYGAWYHRKWVLSKGLSSYDHEFRLLYKFQKADERNFHAWNYRRFVAELKNVADEEELEYTMDMLGSNFSNYSAWHNRSVLLSRLAKQKATGFISKEDVLSKEYDLVHSALFVDSHDQSGWFYHHWLLQQTFTPESPILVSTWPIGGSDLIVSSERNLDAFTAYNSPSGTFPLILYFNQFVEGVNSSTVSVNYLFCKEDLIWRPLSSNNSKKALAWITYLKFPEREDNSCKAYPVEVTLAHSQCIISLSGSTNESRIAFTVSLHSSEQKSTEEGVGLDVFEWGDDNFHACKTLPLDLTTVLSLDQLKIDKDQTAATSKWVIETVSKEIAIFRELLLMENCKIGKLTLARLLIAHDSIMGYSTPFEYEKVNSEEVLELFSDLMIMDPPHSRYYKDQHSSVLMEKEISEIKSLEKHCFYHGKSICLRLNNMSLSKIGSFEHILWIQILDLSHNEIQSIEGLEAMQLLSCLNLSYNKLKSLTALEPLRLLPSLEVLNVSYNEIGDHTIDTTRYLCSSPLTNDVEDSCSSSFDEYENGGDVFTLRGLQLRQLDIAGNAVCNDDFRLVLVKVLPKLKWLDGRVVC